VRADPGRRLVVADAAQLEPRVLAALSGDHALAPGTDDLYTALAAAEFAGARDKAKLALLSAMYGGSGGSAVSCWGCCAGTSRPRWPSSTAPPATARRAGSCARAWGAPARRPARATSSPTGPAPGAGSPATSSCRPPRAEWALILLAELRGTLRAGAVPARPVFFQHDEVVLHAPVEVAEETAGLVRVAALTAGRRLFGSTPVRFPMQVRIVEGYDQH
jgi:DNA polymerase-1